MTNQEGYQNLTSLWSGKRLESWHKFSGIRWRAVPETFVSRRPCFAAVVVQHHSGDCRSSLSNKDAAAVVSVGPAGFFVFLGYCRPIGAPFDQNRADARGT